MARAAGDSPYYQFVLYDKGTGKYNRAVTVNLVSVTSVIKATLAAPQLVPWAYNVTRDNLTGALSVLLDAGATPEQIVELVTDPFELEEFLADNRLRPFDLRDEAADRGREEHSHMELLAKVALELDHGAADEKAQTMLDSPNGFRRAMGSWWLDFKPEVLGCEEFTYSLTHLYAGTCDLRLASGVVDLKSRAAGKTVYDSDKIQVGAYEIAYEEMGQPFGPEPGVLVIRDDGTYEWAPRDIDRTAFLDLLSVFNKRKGA